MLPADGNHAHEVAAVVGWQCRR